MITHSLVLVRFCDKCMHECIAILSFYFNKRNLLKLLKMLSPARSPVFNVSKVLIVRELLKVSIGSESLMSIQYLTSFLMTLAQTVPT